jgi:hypothetical protein
VPIKEWGLGILSEQMDLADSNGDPHDDGKEEPFLVFRFEYYTTTHHEHHHHSQSPKIPWYWVPSRSTPAANEGTMIKPPPHMHVTAAYPL